MPLPLGFVLALATSLFWLPVQAIPPINVPACSLQLPSPLNANSLGQSPCQVAGYLGAVCTSEDVYMIPPVDAALEYTLPVLSAVNCTCSTAYYSVLSACAACQGAVYLTWSEYSSNCSTVYTTEYPNPVPPETAIPHWAFQSYADPGATFNIDLAVAQGGEFYFHPYTPETTASSSKKKSEAGPIAGGVVGGVALLSLLAVGVVFYRRRGRQNRSPQPSKPILDGMDMHATPTPMISQVSTPSAKLYDPSDPTTFPQSHLTQDTISTVQYRPTSDLPAAYSGIPEV
ncbi:hypothetical protein BDP27DRAFT_1402993 [Rhodocollybia butyracea]|uniref:Transmembrane protein n=1 Tax=Rhodocollybia butyracea TaxID=206335 RepID=A0A9P5PSX1_9AGAR|nr:hypothetical protein BDP27DRAFT_1402993 [Rhodocollybia butyracea]